MLPLIPFVAFGAAYMVFDWAVNKGLVRLTGRSFNENLDYGSEKVLYIIRDNTKTVENTDVTLSGPPEADAETIDA